MMTSPQLRRGAGRYDPDRANINRDVVTDIYDLPDDHGAIDVIADDDRPSGAIFWIAICILVPLFMLAGYGVGKGIERLWQ